jgi:PDDEXK-like family of unknown function
MIFVLVTLQGLVPCTNVTERNLLADASKIVERTRSLKCGKSESRKLVCDGLKSLGYDAAVCKAKWEKTSSIPAGKSLYCNYGLDLLIHCVALISCLICWFDFLVLLRRLK